MSEDIYNINYYRGYNDALNVVREHIWRALHGSDLLSYAKKSQDVMIGQLIEDVRTHYYKTHLPIKEAYRLAWQIVRFDELVELSRRYDIGIAPQYNNPYRDGRWRMIPDGMLADVRDVYELRFLWRDPLEQPFIERNVHARMLDGKWSYEPDQIPF